MESRLTEAIEALQAARHLLNTALCAIRRIDGCDDPGVAVLLGQAACSALGGVSRLDRALSHLDLLGSEINQ